MNLSLFTWLEHLRDEALLRWPSETDDDGAHAAHLEGFVRAFALSDDLDDRQLNRLRTVTTELIALSHAFDTAAARVFYGSELFDLCVQGLYGPTVATALVADRRQRRLLIESTDAYEAQCLGQLIVETLSEVSGSGIFLSTWQSAFDENLLKQGGDSGRSGDRAYDRQRSAKYWILDQPGCVEQSTTFALLKRFPASIMEGIGAAQVLLSTSVPEQEPIQRNELRQLVGTHAVIRVTSLNQIVKTGTPLLSIINAQAHETLGYPLSEPVLRHLSARLEGYSWSQGRQSLVCLLTFLEARGILVHFTDEGLERAITDLEHVPETRSKQVYEDSLDSCLAEGLLKGQTLPELLSEFERQAYVYAARVAAVKRPGQNIRVQDLALILKTPRQTVSRKWHAFQIAPDEYLLSD